MFSFLNVKNEIIKKLLISLLAVISAIILPQLFHAVGIITGLGANVGSAFLPMHIPVILAGFFGGALVGATAGILSPIISFAISGMPTAMILPFMVIELTVYGIVSGLLNRTSLNAVLKVIIVLLSGRIARALAVVTSIYVLGNDKLSITAAYMFIAEGVIGIAIQLILLPYIISRKKA